MPKRTLAPSAGQLGFPMLMREAEAANAARRFERETAHLPSTMAEAVPFCRDLIERHHAAMLAGDALSVFALRDDAYRLARRLNGGEPGILAHKDAPGCALARATAAASGSVPLWGQSGAFTLELDGLSIRIRLDGLFGLASHACFWPGFSAHALNWDRPFISETGYRSFLGVHATPCAGLTPDAFVRRIVEAHIARELKGRLVTIDEASRRRASLREADAS